MSMIRSCLGVGAIALAMTFGTQPAFAEPMSWLASILPTFSAADSQAAATTEPGPTGQCCCSEPLYSVRLNALYWDRSNTIFDTTATADVGFDHEFGWELSGLARLADCWHLEGRYFQLGWTTAYTTPDNEGIYVSDLRNFEVNLRYQAAGWLQILGGFRYIALDEAVAFSFTDEVTELAQFSVENDLFGGQIGAVAARSFGRFEVEGVVKAGWFYNRISANGSSTAFTVDPSEGSELSIVLEAGASVAYRITDSIAIRGGYQTLWLGSVVTAGGQAEEIEPLAKPDDLFYHGFFFGGEVRW